jgi:ABC-2 type transport system ATP-binding protein
MSLRTAISIKNLRKDFPSGLRGLIVRAVDDLSLEIKENEIFGLLGPNGSGKSTTIKAILGLLKATQGTISIFGQDCSRVATRELIGYLPEAPYFYRYLSGRELVLLFARLSGISNKKERSERADKVIEIVGLTDACNRPVKTYSKGMLQRIGLAQALVQDPPLLILDEPTAGVDPIGASGIADIIRRLKAEGKTVILCSHLLSQVESLCDRVAVLHRGHLLAEGPLDQLLTEESQFLQIEGLPAAKLPEAQQLLTERFGPAVKLDRLGLRLDEYFLNLVQKADRE